MDEGGFLWVDLALYPFFYYLLQAVEDVNKGFIKTGDKLYELKSMQDAAKKVEVGISWFRFSCSCFQQKWYILCPVKAFIFINIIFHSVHLPQVRESKTDINMH